MHKKYRVIKGEDGKYKLTKGEVKPLNVTRPVANMGDALQDRISREKKEAK